MIKKLVKKNFRFFERNFNLRVGFFFGQRLSGILLLLFLFLHLFTINMSHFGQVFFDAKMELYASWPIKLIFEPALILILTFHLLNGLRIAAINLFGLDRKKILDSSKIYLTIVGLSLISVITFLWR